MPTAPALWFAAYPRANGERRAHRGLRERGFKVYVPQATVWRAARGSRSRLNVPLFGTYLFVAVDAQPGEDGRLQPVGGALYELVTTEGVAGLVGVAGRPRSLPGDWVPALRTQEAAGDFDRTKVQRVHYRPGQAVEIVKGPFTGWRATVIRHAEPETRARIMLQALGGGSMMIEADKLAAVAQAA